MSRRPRTFRWTHLLPAVVLLVAALLRFVGLAAEPLSAPEAGRAWRAWSLAQGPSTWDVGQPGADEPSPLLESVHWWMFWLGADGDASVRIPGAVAGVALVALLLTLESWLGRRRTLILAALVAVDPTLVVMSRRQGEISLGLLVGTLVLLPLLRRGRASGPGELGEGSPRWLSPPCSVWGVGLGLLVASGWAAWGFAPCLLGALFLPANRASDALASGRPRDESAARQGWGWLALGTGAGATAGFVAWPILTDLSGSWTALFLHLVSGCAAAGREVGFGALLLSDPAVFVLGPTALLVLLLGGGHRRHRGFALQIAAGLWGLVLVVVGGRAPEALGLAALPLLAAIVSASATAAQPRWIQNLPRRWIDAVQVIALAVSLVLSLRLFDPHRDSPWNDLLAPTADRGVRLLAADLGDPSLALGRGEHLALELDRRSDPLLAWYLRRVGAREILGPIEASAAGPMAAVLTRDGARPSAWIVRSNGHSVEVGRTYRLRTSLPAPGTLEEARWTSAVGRVTLWRFSGGDRRE